jgi:hypothetical protein
MKMMTNEERIRLKGFEISEMENAIERMNARVTPETAMTIKVANEVFGGTVNTLKGELATLVSEKAKRDQENENARIMQEVNAALGSLPVGEFPEGSKIKFDIYPKLV